MLSHLYVLVVFSKMKNLYIPIGCQLWPRIQERILPRKPYEECSVCPMKSQILLRLWLAEGRHLPGKIAVFSLVLFLYKERDAIYTFISKKSEPEDIFLRLLIPIFISYIVFIICYVLIEQRLD